MTEGAGGDGRIELEIVSDVACPWCFIANRRLARILASDPGTAEAVSIRWRAFLLQPELPAEGVDAPAYFAAKFGGEERVRTMRARVAEAGASEGIRFAFERQLRAANTRLAHRVIALIQGAGADATPAVDALFAGHFEEGLDLSDLEAMLTRLDAAGALDAAATGGLDGASIRDRLAAGDGEASVDEDLRFGAAVGVTGVPFVIANRRLAVSGAQPEAVFRDLLRAAAEQPAA